MFWDEGRLGVDIEGSNFCRDLIRVYLEVFGRELEVGFVLVIWGYLCTVDYVCLNLNNS